MNRVRNSFLAIAIGAALPLLAQAQAGGGPGMQQRDQQRMHAPADDDGTGAPIFGRQLMTAEEMAEHRARMRAAPTAEERARIRAEHHQKMLEQARERGITLPEEPPMGGPGAGPGPGMRQGPGKNRPQDGN